MSMDCWSCGGSGGGDDPQNRCLTCRGTGVIEDRGESEYDDEPADPCDFGPEPSTFERGMP